MSVALNRPMTRDEFFDWVECQDAKYEFDGRQPVAMVGGTNAHGIISGNLNALLHQALRGGPCRSMNSDGGGVAVPGGGVRYPEAIVSCTSFDGRARLFPDPIVVFEVLSDSTRSVDQVRKLREYHAVPSIRRYVLIEQREVAMTVHRRLADEPWSTTGLLAGEILDLPEIGIALPVDELYEGLELAGSVVPG